jgi:hypothetical protein
MDGRRFDDLLRAATQSGSRRTLLGGALAIVSGLFAVSEAPARKKKKGKGKKKKQSPAPSSPPPPSLPSAAATCGALGAACDWLAPNCCGALQCSHQKCCAPNNTAACNVDSDCCDDEDLCEHGACKRKKGDFCNATIVCSDAYPYCLGSGEFGTCQRCSAEEVSTGTDELCCPSNRYCPKANGGRGSCCNNDDCCVPNEDGVECGKLEFPGLESCF